ncbi:hypothetical protein [Silvanigrella paludirubra]|nr:hypothetical protein [Silvanigrella paludirubra]
MKLKLLSTLFIIGFLFVSNIASANICFLIWSKPEHCIFINPSPPYYP